MGSTFPRGFRFITGRRPRGHRILLRGCPLPAAQNGATIPGSPPHHVPVDPEVRVDKNITEGYDLWPRHLGVAALEVLRDSRGRLADDGELLNYGAAQQFRFLKCLKINACDELGNVVGGLNDIGEVQALMPHTRAVLLRARTLGSAVSVRSSIPDPLSARGDATDPASSRRSPPDRCRHPAKRRPACRCRCRGACLRGRRTRKAKAPARGIVRRDLPVRSHRPACHRVGACGPCFVSSIMPDSLERHPRKLGSGCRSARAASHRCSAEISYQYPQKSTMAGPLLTNDRTSP